MTNTGNRALTKSSRLTSDIELQSFELKKHVGAIHSSNHLTLVQRKIANALLFNAYDHILEKDEFQIHITKLCQLIGYDSKDYKKIKQALIALISTVIEWNLIDKGKIDTEGVWNASSIIADASIDGPICSYSYSNKMRKLLYHPEMYGRLNMLVQAQFKSAYGLALYENCIRYQNIRQTPSLEIETFRKLMGVGLNVYPIFRDFKRRVIDTAIAEVNAYAPITVSVTYKKQGRKVTALQFQIQKKDEPISEPVFPPEKCAQYGITQQQYQQLRSLYTEDYILEKIKIIESSSSFKSGKIINLAKYLVKALKEDYRSPQSSKQLMGGEQVQKQREDQHIQYRKYQDKEILKLFALQPAKEKEVLLREFGQSIKKNVYYSLFEKYGLANILVADKFCDFLRLTKHSLVNAVLPFEEFCQIEIGCT